MKHQFLTQYAVRDEFGRFTGRFRLRLSLPAFKRPGVEPALPDRVPVIAGCALLQLCIVLLCAYVAS